MRVGRHEKLLKKPDLHVRRSRHGRAEPATETNADSDAHRLGQDERSVELSEKVLKNTFGRYGVDRITLLAKFNTVQYVQSLL